MSSFILRICRFSLIPALSAFLVSCVVTPPPHPLTQPVSRLSFQASAWRNTWKGDAEDLALTPESDGTLYVSIQGKAGYVHKGAILSASVTQKKLLSNSVVVVTAAIAEGPMDIAIAIHTDEYYESPRVTLTPGESRELTFDLSATDFKSDSTSWRHAGSINMDIPLDSVQLVLYPVAGETRTIRLQSVRLNGVDMIIPPAPRTVVSLTQLNVQPTTSHPSLHGLLEIEAHVSAAADNPFDPDQITVDATFISPSGHTHICPGFIWALAEDDSENDTWRIRFSPNEPGVWHWQVTAKAGSQKLESEKFETTCRDRQTRGGIRVSDDKPRYFELEDGSFYYPIGHNVCWNSLEQYEDQFAKMGRHGENWSRVWIAAWNCEIEWTPREGLYEKGIGWYELRRAEKLDAIVRAAETNGLYLQLVLHEHCRLSAKTNPEWHNNPYNKARGGFLDEPKDFFTHPEARRLASNRLRYIIARWGYSSHVMAWELFNEVDLTDDFHLERDTRWHEEMVEFIRATDPHNRMVTTSYISTPNANVYRLPGIDYVMSHVYIEDVISHFSYLNPIYATFDKPHFIAEFGRHTDDGVDAQDTTGRILHAGIWTQFMMPSGGNAMSWWWYSLIDPHDLYFHFNALASFAGGVDRRGVDWQLQTGLFDAKEGPDARVLALTSPGLLMLWLFDPNVLPWGDGQTEPFKGYLRILGLAQGRWRIEQWDTYTGTELASWEFDVRDILNVPVVSDGPDTAFKLIYLETDREPESTGVLALAPWTPEGRTRMIRNKFIIPRTDTGIVIDGQIDEWEPFPQRTFGPRKNSTPEDNSVAFSVLHDGDHLYVAAKVTDDEVVRKQKADGDLWKDDCLELWINSRNDVVSYFNNMPHNPGCYQINIAPGAKTGDPVDHVVYRHPKLNNQPLETLEAASSITDDGYIIEARIPLADLRGETPVEDANMIGFNISTCDADEDGGTWNHLLWQGTDEWDARQWAEGALREHPTPNIEHPTSNSDLSEQITNNH